jgi:heme/copper-type cytochrome/quinol oxidase subunit 3
MIDKRSDGEKRKVVNPTEARQGTHTFGLRILVISLVLVILGFIATYFIVGMTTTPEAPPVSTESAPQNIAPTEPPPNIPPAE